MFVACLPAADQVAVAVVDRTEARARGASDAPGTAFDLETAPGLELRLRGRSHEARVGWSPRLTLRDVQLGASPELLQRASGSLVVSTSRRLELRVEEEGAYGTQSSAYLQLTPPASSGVGSSLAAAPRVEPLAVPVSLRSVSSRSTAGLRWLPARRWTLGLAGSYLVSGGADDASRALLPLQSGPRVEAALGWSASRLDTVTTLGSAQRVHVSTGSDTVLVEGSEAWSRRLAPTLDLQLAAGVSGVGSNGTRGEKTAVVGTTGVLPVAQATLTRRLRLDEHVHEAQVAVRLAPVVDRLTGTADQRWQATLSATRAASRELALRAQIAAARSTAMNRTASIALVMGDVGVSVRIARGLTLDPGLRVAWQRGSTDAPVPGAGQPVTSWVAYLAAGWSTPFLPF
jgi:hypothetical protein